MSEAKINKIKNKANGNFFKIVIIVILMVIAGFAGYFVFIKYKPAKVTTIISVAKTIEEASFSEDEFTVNLADGSIMRTKIVLNYDKVNTKLGLELDSNNAVRDAIISVIRSKKSTDLATTKDTDNLKGDIIKKVNGVLATGKIINVYYHDILIQ